MSRRSKRTQHQSSEEPEPAVLSPARRRMYRALAVTVVPVLLFSVVELGLRVAGVGNPTGLWVTQTLAGGQRAVDNLYFTWPWFGPRRAREPAPFAVEIPKPEARARVLVLGASAAQGDPDPAFSMSRFMEILLERSWPEVDTEVVNLAMTAINSHVVLPIARDSLGLDPDVLVVYLGNNEVVGPYGAAEGPRGWSTRARQLLVTTRIGQLVQQGAFEYQARRGGMSDWQGMEDYLKHQVAQGDPRLERIYGDFERNVTGILHAAGRAGVPVVLATVAVNLADTPPFASHHRPDLATDELDRWQGLIDQAVRLEAAGDMAGALKQLNSAVALDDQHAKTAYLRGRVLLDLRRYREARLSFAMARDLDVLRFRADSRINGILRGLAGRSWPAPVVLADVESAVDTASPAGIAGSAHLYEHVHLTPTGNYLAARTLVSGIVEESLVPALTKAPPRDLPTEQEVIGALGFSGWSLLQAGDEVLARLERPPFTGTLGAEERARSLSAQVDRLRIFTHGEGLAQSQQVVEAALRNRPDDWVLHYQLGRMLRGTDPDLATSHLWRALELRPTFDLGRRALGRLLLDQDRTQQAVTVLAEVAARHPWSPGAILDHGIALLKTRRVAEADEVLRRVLVLDPEDPEALYHLALARLTANGEPSPAQREEATDLLERALAADPEHQDARRILARIRAQS